MTPSPLYSKLFSLAQAHIDGLDLLSIRTPDAIHAWGHNYLVSRNPKLQDRMNNNAFNGHLRTSRRYLEYLEGAKVHDIVIDEHQRKAVIRMSYFLKPKGSEENVENDLIWVLKFTGEDEVDGGVDGVLIKESVEFVDPAAGAKIGSLLQALHGELDEDARGVITLKDN